MYPWRKLFFVARLPGSIPPNGYAQTLLAVLITDAKSLWLNHMDHIQRKKEQGVCLRPLSSTAPCLMAPFAGSASPAVARAASAASFATLLLPGRLAQARRRLHELSELFGGKGQGAHARSSS